MKKLVKHMILGLSFVALSSVPTFAALNSEVLVYEKDSNPSIGIRVENANGIKYCIKDAKGNIVMEGRVVGSKKDLLVSLHKLGKGAYRFYLGADQVQEFVVK